MQAHVFSPRQAHFVLYPPACPRSHTHSARLVAAKGLLDSLRKAVRGGDNSADSSSLHEDGPELVGISQEGSQGLGGLSDESFGPLAILLVGFLKREIETFREALIAMEADMVKVICCTAELEQLPLRAALAVQPPEPEEPRLGARRAVILSGMYPSEVQETIFAYREAGLPETVWAAAVPQNYERPVRVLVDDVYGDHRFMQEEERRAALGRAQGK